MPLLQTRGAGSARGFGFSATQAGGGGDGTVGIFALGSTVCGPGGATATRNKYTFATCASTSTTSSSTTSNKGAAAGNSTRIIFQIGTYTNNRCKYTYATDTNTAATTNNLSCSGYGVGNSTQGIFTNGSPAPAWRGKYTYATDAFSNLFNMLYSNTSGGYGTGNSTRGIIAVGYAGGMYSAREKYTYATCTSTSCGVANSSVGNAWGSATGNSTRGFFQFGYRNYPCNQGDFRSNIYTYATCTSVSGACTACNWQTGYSSAAGNSTRGIFAIGLRWIPGNTIVNSRCKYTYASNTRTRCGVGTATTATNSGAAASFQICVNA